MNLKPYAAALLLAACAVPAATALVDVSVSTAAVDCITDGVPLPATQPGVSATACSIQVRDGPQPIETLCGPLGDHGVDPSVSTHGCAVTVRA